jgi:hypothetical protein
MAHEHVVYMMLVDSAARTGDESAIRKFAPRLEELVLRDDHKPYLAVAHRAWGVAHRLSGEYTDAETRLGKALGIFEELESRWQIARTLFEMGELAPWPRLMVAPHTAISLALRNCLRNWGLDRI